MKIHPLLRPVCIASFALVGPFLVSSCSLPPGEAWRQIQRDGLFVFVQNQRAASGVPSATPAIPGSKQQLMASNTPTPTAPTRVVQPPPPVTPGSSLASSRPAGPPKPLGDSSQMQTAIAVEGMEGYVRTPFTTPGRLVDVRGMMPGSKAVCPYTQRPFIVPAAVAKTQSQVAATSNQKPATSPQPRVSSTPATRPSTPAPQPTTPPASAVPKTQVASNTTQPKPAATTSAQPKPAVSSTTQPKPAAGAIAQSKPSTSITQPKPNPNQASTPPPAKLDSAPPAAPKLPFGDPIPGRPGFVNSPYAEKHQLVDVTGLSVGTEVKCPYTGKLFKVPLQEQAKKD